MIYVRPKSEADALAKNLLTERPAGAECVDNKKFNDECNGVRNSLLPL